MSLDIAYFAEIEKLLLKVLYIKVKVSCNRTVGSMNSTKNVVGPINSNKNKLNSEIIFNFHPNPTTHYGVAWIQMILRLQFLHFFFFSTSCTIHGA